jgi:hypothetical protein
MPWLTYTALQCIVGTLEFVTNDLGPLHGKVCELNGSPEG